MTEGRRSWHVALWIAGLPVMIAGLRIWMFSQGDSTLLRVLLESLPVLTVLTASTLQVLPWVLITFGAMLLFNFSTRRVVWMWMARNRGITFLGCIAALLIAMVTPLWSLLAMVAIYVAVGVLVIARRSEKPWGTWLTAQSERMDNKDPAGALVGLIVLPLLLNQFTSFTTFWLPREIVTVDGRPTNAYVLTVSGEWTTLLTPERAVLRVATAEVSERIVCDQGETQTLLNLRSDKKSDPELCDPGKPIAPVIDSPEGD